MDKVTIQIKTETHSRLIALKRQGEDLDEVLNTLVDVYKGALNTHRVFSKGVFWHGKEGVHDKPLTPLRYRGKPRFRKDTGGD